MLEEAMPLLKKTSPQLALLNGKSWVVDRLLPDVNAIYAVSVGDVQPSFLSTQYALETAYIWQESTQMAIGNVLQSVGVPLFDVFEDIIDELNIDVVVQVKDKLVDVYENLNKAREAMKSAGDAKYGGGAMDVAVSAGIGGAVKNLIDDLPAVGWVAKLVWNVSKLIRGIINLAQDSKSYGQTQTIYPDSRFSPTWDNIVLNRTLDTLRLTADWSRLFGPPSLGNGQGTLADYWVKATESGAKEIYRKHGWYPDGAVSPEGDPIGGDPIDWLLAGWTGMVPGTTMLHRGIRIQGDQVSDLGPSRYPSTQNVLFWLWKDIIGKKGNAGPAMYTIDTEELQTWRMYIHGLHQFIYETGNGFSGTQKTKMMKLLNTKMGKKVFGWGTKIKPTENETDNYQPVKEANALLARQDAFLDTLLVAYIDEDYAALKNNAALRAKWVSRRKDLLAHPARCSVDLLNVPDSDYVEALKASGVGSPVCQQAAQSYAAAPLVPPVDVPEGQHHGFDELSPEKKKKKGTQREIGYLPLLAVGVGVGAWYAYKKGVFQKLLR
jgi:hypothetical protein